MHEIEKTITYKDTRFLTTNNLVKISVLGVLSYILMFIHFPLPIFPGFLKIDVAEVPAIIGGFALGPIPGMLIVLIKNILHFLIQTSTGGVGELSNFIIGTSYVIPAALVYHHKKDRFHAILGVVAGIISMTAVGTISNTHLIIPFYSKIMPIEAIIKMGTVVNSRIVDIPTLVLYGITPFNLFKSSLLSLVTILIYKKVSPILKR